MARLKRPRAPEGDGWIDVKWAISGETQPANGTPVLFYYPDERNLGEMWRACTWPDYIPRQPTHYQVLTRPRGT